jgi:hypothetical protein
MDEDDIGGCGIGWLLTFKAAVEVEVVVLVVLVRAAEGGVFKRRAVVLVLPGPGFNVAN